MKINRFFPLPCDPFISHMRIAYEDAIRKETEEYWRNIIAQEVRGQLPYLQNIDMVISVIRKDYDKK